MDGARQATNALRQARRDMAEQGYEYDHENRCWIDPDGNELDGEQSAAIRDEIAQGHVPEIKLSKYL